MLKDLNLLQHSKTTRDQIINYVGSNAENLEELMGLFLGENPRISQVTSWAIGLIGELQPQLFDVYHNQLLDAYKDTTKHNAIRRNISRIYQFIEIPEELEGEWFELCVQAITNPKEAIAVRANCIIIAERIAAKYKELIPELMITLANVKETDSAGVKNRAIHSQKRLGKLKH